MTDTSRFCCSNPPVFFIMGDLLKPEEIPKIPAVERRCVGKNHVLNMGLSENRVYSQWNSHLIGIMISKTIGFRGTLFSDTPIWPVCREIMKRKSVSPMAPWIWCEDSPKTNSWSRSLVLGPRNPQMNNTTASTGHSYVWWACSVTKNIQSLLSVKIQGLYIKVSPTRTPDFYKSRSVYPAWPLVDSWVSDVTGMP